MPPRRVAARLFEVGWTGETALAWKTGAGEPSTEDPAERTGCRWLPADRSVVGPFGEPPHNLSSGFLKLRLEYQLVGFVTRLVEESFGEEDCCG